MPKKHAQDAAASPKKPRPLTPKQQAFVDEYLVDMNATQAAIRAKYSAKTAGQIGEKLLKKAEIAAAIEEARKDRSARTQITQDMVLNRWWEIATADPNELIQHRRVCCRHCYGRDHAYQWKDEAEYERACANAEQNDLEPPSDEGGYGFDPTERPHPRCPKCFGEGHGDVFVTDTRDLSPSARALYAGVKVTKEGFEVKMQDQGKALENVARHLGMFNDKLTLKGDAENPIALLLQQVSGATLKPSGQGGDQ